MGNFEPIPSYTNVNVTTGQKVVLNSFIQTVHNAGQAYLHHTCGHEGAPATLNPTIPANSIVPVTYGSSATTGCSNWSYTESALNSSLTSLENDFRTSKTGKLIDAQSTKNFLTSYFHLLCRIYGQRFSYYSSYSSSSTTVWSGIGLRSSSYMSLSEYTTQLTNAKVLDKISTKSLIDAAEMHRVLRGLMSFNSTFETWNDYGQRNKKSTKSESEKIYSWGADHGWWIAYHQNIANQKAAQYAAQHGITAYTVTHEATGHWGYVTFFDSYINYTLYVLEAQNPATTYPKIHS